MRRYVIWFGAYLALLYTAASGAQVGGNLTKYPPNELRLEITSGENGAPILNPQRFEITTGDYYRLTISSDGAGKSPRGGTQSRRFEAPEFLSNVHLRILTINDIEVHLQSMSFRAIELDEAGEASFTFVPIRVGEFPMTVGPDPLSVKRQVGESGFDADSQTALGVIHVK
ncbi:MAG: hypothetical protein AAGG55_06940 [Pseudomonadota bacterium]